LVEGVAAGQGVVDLRETHAKAQGDRVYLAAEAEYVDALLGALEVFGPGRRREAV
jgi:hypothetical protein